MDFRITYQPMADGTMLAEARVAGEGPVFLGYVAPAVVFDDGETRRYVKAVIEARRKERAEAEARAKAFAADPGQVADMWAAIMADKA